MNILSLIVLAPSLVIAAPRDEPAGARVLVFTRTLAFRHDSIPAGIAAVRELGAEGGFAVDATEDGAAFTPENLRRYRAVVFLSTSGDVLDERQKAAFRGFIEGGGGLAAIHQGITTLDKWPWYVDLVGGVKFAGHPRVQAATCRCESRDHPATKSLPDPWTWTDEWYNFDPSPRPRTHVLLTVDEASYQGGTMGKDHPISWYDESRGGRVWCTALGHTKEGYARDEFRRHLLGGIRYAAGLAEGSGKADGAGAGRRGTAPGVRVSEVTILGDMDCFKVETSTASGAPASRASSTRTVATGSPTGPAAGPAASTAGCPSAASRPRSSTAATATASIRRITRSPAASRRGRPTTPGSSPRPATAGPPAPGTSTPTTRH